MKLLVCAMEASSNIHLKELKKYLSDDVELVGVFDKELGNPLYDLTALAIMGIVDALKKLRFFFKLRDELVDLAKDCDKVLLMDSSGFNLPLAKKLRETFRGYINTFFSPITPVYNHKVINFALYQQGVERVL